VTLKQAIKEEARRLGFFLAGVVAPNPPAHLPIYEDWLEAGCHGEMDYLASERARAYRADPRLILPECKSILALAYPYASPAAISDSNPTAGERKVEKGKIAAYARGEDYHLLIPEKLQALVAFIEAQTGQAAPNRYYTDTGPLLERDLAQSAGLGWIGKNSCLIHPKSGSFFFLAEILLGIALEPDPPFTTDHCGTCARCIEACPTGCILPNRTVDARRCISYLTIENKGEIPPQLRQTLGNQVFGCDICQEVCPWNRFAPDITDVEFPAKPEYAFPDLVGHLALSPAEFNRKFKDTPVKRAKRRGYLRNIAVALGNAGSLGAIPALEAALNDPEALVREHAAWALTILKTGKRKDDKNEAKT